MVTRREFLLNSCRACLLISTAGIAASLMESCSSIKSVRAENTPEGPLKVALTAFTEHKQVLVRSSATEFDILVNKKADGTFNALLMQCTHQDQPLTPTSTSINCPSHGSRFDLEGNVIISPATRRLTRYPVTVTASHILITLTPLPA